MRFFLHSRTWLSLVALAIALPAGLTVVGQLLPPSSIVVDDSAGAPSFQTTGTWITIALPGRAEQGSLRYGTKGTATWMFSVPAGTYRVEVSVPAILRISQQTYSISDGVMALGSFVVAPVTQWNQKTQSNWVTGTTVTTNGTIVVSLSAESGMRVADAVRLTLVSSTSSTSSSVISSSSSSAPGSVCGNGVVETSEQCDYGSMNGQPCMAPAGTSCTYCSASCVQIFVDEQKQSSSSSSAIFSSSSSAPGSVCGNGVVETSEQCDYGSMNGQPCMAPAGTSCTYCSASCVRVIVDGVRPSSNSSSSPTQSCGNGVVEGQEQCDNGVANGKICDSVMGYSCAYCSTSCTKIVVNGQTGWSSSSVVANEPVCGNGTIEGGEQCDGGSANGKICDSVMGGSCTYCSVSCIPVTVDGSRSSSAASSSSATTVGTCSDGIDNDADGGADVAFVTTAIPTGSKRRSSFISFDSLKNVSYFMYQDESNGEQTVEARNASNAVTASRKFNTAAIRRDVFGSPAIDSWTKIFTKPYYSDFTTANGDSVYGLIADSTVATIGVGVAGTPAPRTTKEAKVVRYSSDLSKIEAVLSTGADRFQHGRLFATPNGKFLVLFAVGMIRRVEVPNAANEYSAPFILVIDPATFTVKARYVVATDDMSVPYPLFVGNDKVVFAINRMKQPMYSVGMFANVQRQPVQVIDFIPSTGTARVVDQPYNIIFSVPGDPRAVSDGTSAYITVANETTALNGQRTQVPYLARIDLSTLSTAGLVTLPSDYGGATRVIRTLSNGYVAALRTRYLPQTNSLDEEVLLYDTSKFVSTVLEQKATIEEGSMLRTPDGLLIRTNHSIPRTGYANYNQVTGAFYDYEVASQSMVVRSLQSDPQCTGMLMPE